MQSNLFHKHLFKHTKYGKDRVENPISEIHDSNPEVSVDQC